MATHDGNDTPERPALSEPQVLQSADAQEIRNVSGEVIAATEAKRTNASDGSLRDRARLVAEQEESIEIVGFTGSASRQNRLTEKDLLACEHTTSKQAPIAHNLGSSADGGTSQFNTQRLKMVAADSTVSEEKRVLAETIQEMRVQSKALGTPTDALDAYAKQVLASELAKCSESKTENIFKLSVEKTDEQNEWQAFTQLPAGQQRQVIEAFSRGSDIAQDSYSQQINAVSESVPKGFYNVAKSICDCAVNASQFVYDLYSDPTKAQKTASEVSDQIGKTISNGLHLSGFLSDYSSDVIKHGDWNRPVSDLAKVVQIIDERWNETPLEKRTEKASELIASLGIAAPAGFVAKLANSTKLIAALDELDAALNGVVSAAKDKSAHAFGKLLDEILQPVGDTGTGTGFKLPVPKNSARDSSELIVKMEGHSSHDLPSRAHRGDHDVTSRTNTKGRPKSFINEEGDLVPANPIGYYKGEKVTIAEHLNARQCRGAKANSPYTSFSHGAKVIGKYGGEAIELDVDGLQKAVLEGKIPGVRIYSHSEILQELENSRFKPYTKQQLILFAKADKEIIVEGIIPKEYFKVIRK